MLDELGQPNAGPFSADATMVQFNSTDSTAVYRYEFFMYGHFSKFIRPGAIRVLSQSASSLGVDHVAFVLEDGRRVAVLASNGAVERAVQLQWRGWAMDIVVCKACVITVVW
jgi:glucosylceramidase